MKEDFVKKLLKLVSKSAGCGIQHAGCPCNTCFHTWAEDELELNSDFAHKFWLVVLALRGDYTQEELEANELQELKEQLEKLGHEKKSKKKKKKVKSKK